MGETVQPLNEAVVETGRPTTLVARTAGEWVEVEVVAFDGRTRVPNCPVVVIDCEGGAHPTRTGEDGIARVRGCPKGPVELKFPDRRVEMLDPGPAAPSTL